MPALDGLEVCRRLRAAGDRTPVLVLTARDAVADRVRGLDAGADDYLVKPFALEELIARLRALLRRTGTPAAETLSSPTSGSTRAATPSSAAAGAIELTRTEFLLLELLMRHPRQVLTRVADLRPRVGLRLRPGLQLARGLRRLPAAQARRAAADPHRARRRLRAARAMSSAAGSCSAAPPRSRSPSRSAAASPTSSSGTRCAARSTPRCAAAVLRAHRARPAADTGAAADRRGPVVTRATSGRATAAPPLPSARGARRGRGGGRGAGPYFADQRTSTASTCACTRPASPPAPPRGRRGRSARSTTRCSCCGSALGRARARRHRRWPCSSPAWPPAPPCGRWPSSPPPPSTSPARATCSQRIAAAGDDELSRLAARVQHDARGAGAVPAGAAPAGRRRVARAAHAAHLAAHQPRGARALRRPRRPRPRPDAPRPRRPARGADRARRRPRRAGPRRRAEPPPTEDVRLDLLVAAAVERARRHAPARRFCARHRAGARARRAGAARPRGGQPARQRGEVERDGRGAAAAAAS